MAGHPSGDPEIVRQHIEKQRKGDQELAENRGAPPEPRGTDRDTGSSERETSRRRLDERSRGHG